MAWLLPKVWAVMGGNEYKLRIVAHGWWEQEVMWNYMNHNFYFWIHPFLKTGNQGLKTEAPTPISEVVFTVHKGYNNPHTHLHTDGWTGCLVYVYL